MLKIENMLNFMILPFFYRVGDQHDHKQKKPYSCIVTLHLSEHVNVGYVMITLII